MLYRISNGSVTLGNNTILEEIDFEVHDKEKVGIVGRNGCGKTTLLKSIIGDLELEPGLRDEKLKIDKVGNYNIGYIKQDNIIDNKLRMIDYILLAYKDILMVEKKLDKLSLEISNSYSEEVINKYNDLTEQYRYLGGYNYKKEYEIAISKFGFKEEDKYKKLSEFSLGQLTKIAFIKLLLSKPDLLVLDEPTNHLDIETTLWLEDYLKNYPKSIVLVSHDRMFLDNVCNVIYEIEYGCLKRYTGNYSFYLKKKSEDYEKNLKDYERQKKEIERLNKIVQRFKYKPTKASMAKSKLKQIEHMVKIDKPNKFDVRTFRANFDPEFESYRNVLKVRNLGIGYDNILSYINVNVERGNKLGIIGENGIGKSTFLKTLVGKIPPCSGKFIFGDKVKVGYFDQSMDSLDVNNNVYEEMDKEFPDLSPNNIRNVLGAFEFRGDDIFKKIKDLSGGEKVRLRLCKILQHRPNVLILDEPTNHLDIIGKETIERMLVSYRGTIIMVSHDRYLISRVCDCLLVFKKDSVNYYSYGYKEYIEKNKKVDMEEKVLDKVNKKKEYVSSFKEKSKLQRKLNKIEEDISIIEDKIKNLNDELLKEEVYMDFDKARDIQNEIDNLKSLIENKTGEWEEIVLKLDE